MHLSKQDLPISRILTGIMLLGILFTTFGMGSMPIAQAQDEKVNLTPYTPEGWDNPIVASSVTETHNSGTLYDTQYTYIDWAIKNTGGATSASFKTCVYYDGLSLQCWDNEGLGFEETATQSDWILTIPTLPGVHHIEVVADVGNAVKETNEEDNSWGFDFQWSEGEQIGALTDAQEPLINDMLTMPDPEIDAQSSTGSSAPGYNSTSDYMMGSVAVGIIFPESTGNGENWTQARKDQAVAEIQTGLNWWAQQATANGLSLTYTYDIRTVSTTYEPITMSMQTNETWISQVMANMGYSGTSGYTQTRDYINNLRTQRGTKWAYTFFVVDSLNDTDGRFSDGKFGYAYLGGPYVMMTSDNYTWGIANMDRVAAHETGHIFHAGDNYYQAGYGGCTSTTDPYGYLGIPNSNCAYNNPSAVTNVIMNKNDWNLHWTTAQQVGWRDLDGDGRKDPLDTTPGINMNAYSPDPTLNAQLTYTGYAYENPYPHHTCCTWYDTTINTITSVQYRVDNGTWINAAPTDGSFNTDYEQFTFTTAPLSATTHTIEVKVQNSIGATNPTYWSDTVTVQGSALPGGFNKSAPLSGATGLSTSMTISWGGSSSAASYQYCYDTVNDNVCSWISNGTGTSVTLNGLNAGATYYWHARAINSNGMTYSNGSTTAFWSFTTQVAAPGGFTRSAPANGATGLSTSPTISWGGSSGATSYQYCYDTSNDNACTNWISNGTSMTKTLSGLSTNTTYYWHVRAVNNGGTTYANGSATLFWAFTTQGAAVSVTANPNSVNMDSYGYEPVTYSLRETAGGSATITAMTSRFYTQSGVALSEPIGPYSIYIPILPYQTTYWDDGIYLPPEVVDSARAAGQYAIVYKTTFTGGTINASVSVLIVLPPAPFSKISPVPDAGEIGSSVTLSWNSAIGATHYEVCYKTKQNEWCKNWLGTYNTSMTISGLAPSTIYYWQVRAISSAGITYADYDYYWVFATASSADMYEPDNTSSQAKWISMGTPQLHSIVPATDVDWVKFQLTSTSAVDIETSGSGIYADTQIWLYNSSLTQLGYDDDGGYNMYSYIHRECDVNALPPGTYYVKVDEYGNNNEIQNYVVSVNITQACVPNPPTNLIVSRTSPDSITLSWDDNSNSEIGFNIYRWGYASGEWKFIYLTSVGANTTSFTQYDLPCDNGFNYYEVSAYNGGGESPHTGWVQGITDPCMPADLTITDFWLSNGEPYTNDNLYAYVEVTNYSATRASPFWIDIYVDDTPVGCGDWSVYYIGADGLDPYSTTVWSVKIRPDSQSAGLHQIRAFVDSGCDVTEGNEGDNITDPLEVTYLQTPPPPVHDNISNALTIAPFPYAHSVDVRGATVAPTDPIIPISPVCDLAPGLATVWYKYTPSFNTTVIFDTYGSDYDTFITVWAGSPGAMSLLGCNDDSANTAQSYIQVNLTAGTTYYIQVAEFNGWNNNNASPLPSVDVPPGASSDSRPSLKAGVPVLPLEKPGKSKEGEVGALAGGGLVFHASFVTRTISGNTGVGGVLLSYTDETPKTITSDGNGNYSLPVPTGWNGTVTPSKFGYIFSPLSKTYSNVTANLTGQNYIATSLLPGVFGKSGPVSSTINMPLSTPLSWSPSAGATSYDYCYSVNPGCSSWSNTTGTTATINGLTTGTVYYWQVRGRNIYGTTEANGGAYWTFRTGEKPAAFSKLNPLNGAINQPLTPTLNWSASNGVTPVTYYEYCYDTTNDNNCALWRSIGLSTSATLSGLTPLTTYYWQVRAVNAFGTTAWNTNWYSFKTATLKNGTYRSIAAQDGWIVESSETSNNGGTATSTGMLRAGDDGLKRQYVSILSFDTAPMPDNVVISRASVKIYKASSTMPDPFNALGGLVANMQKGYFGSKSSLAAEDFSAAGAPVSTAGKFAPIGGNWYQMTISPASYQYINLMGLTQFRIRFALDDNNDKIQNMFGFYGGENPAYGPVFVIEYTTK